MVIIKFQDGTDWFKANWVFRQFTEDIVATFPNDTALTAASGKGAGIRWTLF